MLRSLNMCYVVLLFYLGSVSDNGRDLCYAEGPRNQKNIEERYPFNSDGDGIYVPIKVGEKTILAAIDTGSTLTVFDSSLLHRLGHRKKSISTSTPDGDVDLDVYEIAGVRIGRLAPRIKMVTVADLRDIREVAGHDVMGIIGMDILAEYVLRLDFDKGIVALSTESPPIDDGPPVGKRIGVEFKHGIPFIPVRIPARNNLPPLNIHVRIDTGWSGLGSGRLERELFSNLSESGGIADLSNGLSETLAGKRTSRKGMVSELQVGDYQVAGLRMSEGGPNLVGIGFLSRFNVTLDFPNAVAVLSESRRFDDGPDARDLSGLHLWHRDKAVRVHSVDKGSPAAAAGLQAGDVILRIGSRDAALERLHALRLALCTEGSVNVTIRRGETETPVRLNLGKQNKATH